MALYGLSLYGEDYYGRDVVVAYSVGEMTAEQTGYNELTLHWTTPLNTNDWGQLWLVRNPSGYPSSKDDGDVLLELTPDTPQNSYTDSGLTGGRFYYYAIFLSSAFPDYDASTTYQAGDTVSYGGNHWLCTVNGTLNVTPIVGSPAWEPTNATAQWNRAGQAGGLAVYDYGYQQRLYDLVPTPYATSQDEITTPKEPSDDLLYRYLAILGWGLATTRTELGEEEHLNDVGTMPLSRMELLASQLGVDTEASITPRLRRLRVMHAAELGRRRGTVEAIKESIYDIAGYDCDISVSTNMMLDADQAEFYNPQYSAWDPSVNYLPGAIVSFGDYLYSATPSTIRVEAETCPITLNGAPSYLVTGNTAHATYSNNTQVLIQSNKANEGATFTLTIPAAGTYDLAIGVTRAFDYGIAHFAVDGVDLVTAPKFGIPLVWDGYAKYTTPATSLYLGRFSFTAGDHTVTVTVTGKNALSGKTANSNNNGYQMGVDYFTYTPTGTTSAVGVEPTGTTTSNAFWTYYHDQTSDGLDTPLTKGISTWEQVSLTSGAHGTNASLSLHTGMASMTGESGRHLNKLVMANGTGVTATLMAHSLPHAAQTTWDATTTYPRNSYVSYNGISYRAILPTQGDVPDVDRRHWTPDDIAISGTDRYLVSSYGIPLGHPRTWAANVSYAAGDVVQYLGQLYRATVPVRQEEPTGGPTDTAYWAWAGSAQRVYTASAYTDRYSGTSTVSRSMAIEWYDAEGELITTIAPSVQGTNPDLLVTFDRNTEDLVNEGIYTEQINGLTWKQTSADPGYASSGMFYWNTRTDTTASGRHLFFAYDRSDNISVGITFITKPPTGVEHGITFRRTDEKNTWSVSRTRLAKIVSGTLTTVATWNELGDGARVYVQLSGTSIKVMQYQQAGLAPNVLATVSDSFNSSATGIGLFERTY